MGTIKFGGKPASTIGSLPKVGSKTPDFKLTRTDLSDVTLADFLGSKLVLNIFPSVGTGVCAKSIREFNQKAANLEGVKVLCISKDLPFAQKEFCGAEGIENVEMLSDYKNGKFGVDYGVTLLDSPFEGLLARSIVVLDKDGNVVYNELVGEISDEPDYAAAIEAVTHG